MKFRYFVGALLGLVVFSLFSTKVNATDLSQCLHMNVHVSATNWPGGAPISATCDGDTGPSGCWSDSGSTSPNGTISLMKCSCPPYASGCVNIPTASFPPSCTYNLSGPTCGVNTNTIDMYLTFTCPAPPTPCPGGVGYCGDASGNFATSCQYGAEPTSWSQGSDNWCSSPSNNPNYNQANHCYTKCKPAPANYTCVPAGGSCNPSSQSGQSCTGGGTWTPMGGTCALPNTCMKCSPPVTQPPVTQPPVTQPPVTQPPVTQPPVCGADCSTNANKCQNISGCNYCNPTSKKCEAPPVCGADCSTNPNVCQNISGCNYCNPTSKKCEAPPQCGANCATNPNICQNITGCTYCNPTSQTCTAQPSATPTSTPVPTATPTSTPSPSPTPYPYDASMCSCDGLNFTPINLGVTTNITAYGKVLAVNKNYAKIPTFTFTFYQSAPNGTTATIVKQEKVNTTTLPEEADKQRYQAIWALNLPSTLDTTQTYRIQAHPDCSRKSAAALFDPFNNVLGSTTHVSLWDRVVNFFSGLFGGGSSNVTQVAGPTATPTLTAQQKKSLQLKTFTPVDVSTGVDAQNCTFIKFSFKH